MNSYIPSEGKHQRILRHSLDNQLTTPDCVFPSITLEGRTLNRVQGTGAHVINMQRRRLKFGIPASEP